MAFRFDDSTSATRSAMSARRGGPHALPFHMQFVGRRLYINAKVRFLVVAGIVIGALGGKYILGIQDLDVRRLLALAGLLGLFNTGIFLVARRHNRIERRDQVCRFLMGLTHLTISVDFLFLSVAIWLVGGAKSPFQVFYLVHVILAALLLSPRAACAHALFGYALLSGLVLGQWWGIIPIHFPVGAVNSTQPLHGGYVLTVLLVYGMLMALSLYLLTGITSLLRKGEEQLRTANAKLERVSGIQRDFLHIAVHDLKSPVAAAKMLLHSVELGADPPLTDEQVRRIARVQLRLDEVTAFLRDFEVLAALDSADVEKHREEIDVAALLRSVVEQNQDLAQVHHHALRLEVADGLPRVFGTGRLIREAVANLVTNAIKYTPDNGIIVARARREKDVMRIEVEDNGIGIAPEDEQRLFQEFVRVRRKDGPAGKVSGSGLGLSIVRRIVEANGGEVGVVSEVGEGSTFFILLPCGSAPEATAQDRDIA